MLESHQMKHVPSLDAPQFPSQEETQAAVESMASELTRLQAANRRLRDDLKTATERARHRLTLVQARDQTIQELCQLNPEDRKSALTDLQPGPANDEIRRLRAKLHAEIKSREKAQQTLNKVLHSRRMRAGSLVVEAVRKPGWNTIALPWRLFGIRNLPEELPDGAPAKAKKP